MDRDDDWERQERDAELRLLYADAYDAYLAEEPLITTPCRACGGEACGAPLCWECDDRSEAELEAACDARLSDDACSRCGERDVEDSGLCWGCGLTLEAVVRVCGGQR